MTEGSRVERFLADRPDDVSSLREILAVDEKADSWTFDDVPVDSGTFGELVSRGIVESDGDRYRLADPDAVRVALGDESETVRDDETVETADSPSFSLSVPDARVAGMVAGTLLSIALVRSLFFGAVFQDGRVVLGGNDPYYYRYWVEQLLTSGQSLAALSGPTDGEPLTIVVLARLSGLVGGADAAGVVLAVYPVVAAVVCGGLLYLLGMRVTGDRRVALAAVVLLAVTPGHALRTALGFADHHAFDYVWLTLTALCLAVLVASERPRTDRRTALATAGLGIGVGAQLLAWDNGALLVVPVAVVVASDAVLAVRADHSPITRTVPIAAGLGLAAGLTLFGHVLLGWHSLVVASVPVLLFLGTVAVAGVAELGRRADRSWREVAVGEGLVGALGLVVVFGLFPDAGGRLSRGLGFLGRTDDVGEVRALVSTELGFLFLFGFLLVLVDPMLVLVTRRLLGGESTWLVPCTYGWYFLGLSLFQIRFVGELSVFAALFAGLGFVWLASVVDIAGPPTPFDGDSMADWTPGRPALSTVGAVLALFVLVAGFATVQSAVKVQQATTDADTYETAAWMAEYADQQGWTSQESYVFSQWGDNRLYNYFVNGNSRSYRYARANYEAFLSETDPDAATEMVQGRARFVVTERLPDAPPRSMQARLHENLGSRAGNVDGLGRYRALYASETGDRTVFTPVAGQRLAGQAAANETVRVTTNVTVPGATFTYERSVRTGPDGSYELLVPYAGEYTIDNGTRTTTRVVGS